MPAGAVVAPGRWPLGSSVSCGSAQPGKILETWAISWYFHGISMYNVHISIIFPHQIGLKGKLQVLQAPSFFLYFFISFYNFITVIFARWRDWMGFLLGIWPKWGPSRSSTWNPVEMSYNTAISALECAGQVVSPMLNPWDLGRYRQHWERGMEFLEDLWAPRPWRSIRDDIPKELGRVTFTFW